MANRPRISNRIIRGIIALGMYAEAGDAYDGDLREDEGQCRDALSWARRMQSWMANRAAAPSPVEKEMGE